MTKAQLIQGIKDLQKLGVKKFGMHSFLASNTVTNDYYPELASKLFKLALEIREETGITLDFINLSGGIGVNYRLMRRQMILQKSDKVFTKLMMKF